jgi:hypothetical protein
LNDVSPAFEPVVYHFRPRLVGGEVACKLGENLAEFIVGIRETRVAYPMITRVRLSYRPTNMSMRRYIVEIWPRGGVKVEVASVSFLPSLEVRDHSPEFRRFVEELHRRIIAARGECEFVAGFPAWRWWPLAIVGVASAIGGVVALFFALSTGQWFGTALLLGLGGFFLWQIWALVTRNRPAHYSPDAIPEYVLPAVR